MGVHIAHTHWRWHKNTCNKHQTMHDLCACQPPFTLHTFPTEHNNPDARQNQVYVQCQLFLCQMMHVATEKACRPANSKRTGSIIIVKPSVRPKEHTLQRFLKNDMSTRTYTGLPTKQAIGDLFRYTSKCTLKMRLQKMHIIDHNISSYRHKHGPTTRNRIVQYP